MPKPLHTSSMKSGRSDSLLHRKVKPVFTGNSIKIDGKGVVPIIFYITRIRQTTGLRAPKKPNFKSDAPYPR